MPIARMIAIACLTVFGWLLLVLGGLLAILVAVDQASGAPQHPTAALLVAAGASVLGFIFSRRVAAALTRMG